MSDIKHMAKRTIIAWILFRLPQLQCPPMIANVITDNIGTAETNVGSAKYIAVISVSVTIVVLIVFSEKDILIATSGFC